MAGPLRWAWAVGGIADALSARRYLEAHARTPLFLAAADPAPVDSGSWLLGSEYLLEPAAPLQSFAKHRPPESSEAQHTRILDPRWISVAVARINERESFIEVRHKLENPRPPNSNEPGKAKGDDKKGAGRGNGPKGGRGSGESETK